MKRSSLLSLLLAMLIPAFACAAEAKLQALHINGSASARAIWLVQTLKPDTGDAYSLVYRRNEGDAQWQLDGTLPTPPVQTTVYGDALAMVLPKGQWLILGQGTGRPLPQNGRLFALAGNANTLWAIGTPGAPTTAPAATQAGIELPATRLAATTAPSSPAQLYQLTSGKWEIRAVLPAGARADATALGLTQQSMPLIAYEHDGAIHLSEWQPDGTWQSLGTQPADGYTPRSVTDDSGRIVVYLAAAGKASELLVHDTQWRNPVGLPPAIDIQAFGLAGGQYRFIFAENNAVKERRLSARTFAIEGADTPLVTPVPWDPGRLSTYLNWGMTILIALAMLHTYSRRNEYQRARIDWTKVQLAPLGQRFFAGLIDFVPVIVATLYAKAILPNVETPTDFFTTPAAIRIYLIGVAIYIAHTMLFEVIAGRSVGKMVTHLRIIAIDGTKPGVVSMIMRNLLRLVDLTLLFTLVMMFLLPLRQRMGDLAGGTLVVTDRKEDIGPDA